MCQLGEQICLDLQDSDFDPTVTRRVPMFSDLSDAVHDAILKRVTKKSYGAGDTICKQGSSGDHMFFVKKGALNVIVDGVEVGSMGADAFFGEMALLSPDGKRTSTVVATEPTELFRLSRFDFNEIVAAQPTLVANLASEQHFVVHNQGPVIEDRGTKIMPWIKEEDGKGGKGEEGDDSCSEDNDIQVRRRNSIVMDALNKAKDKDGIVVFEGIAADARPTATVNVSTEQCQALNRQAYAQKARNVKRRNSEQIVERPTADQAKALTHSLHLTRGETDRCISMTSIGE